VPFATLGAPCLLASHRPPRPLPRHRLSPRLLQLPPRFLLASSRWPAPPPPARPPPRSRWRAQIPVEIISVDSALVYRGMDIGTAKPTAAEQASGAAPPHRHHRRDARAYSAPLPSVADATRLIGEDHARAARCRCWSGGTMMYFKGAVRRHRRHARGRHRRCARSIEAEAAAHRLACDARTARAGRPGDGRAPRARRTAQRIQRALEVMGKQRQAAVELSRKRAQDRAACRTAACCSHSSRRPRLLHGRIATRFDADAGPPAIVDEVRALRARGDLSTRSAFDALRRLPPGLGDARCLR
jgi:tRNA dimethylallyltransferase